MTGALERRIAQRLDSAIHPSVAPFARHLADQAGAQAVLFYGSNLRTGELEGVLDFYLLMPGGERSRIWPRVSYHEWSHDGHDLRAKVATMAMQTFAAAASGQLRDTTIWARFVQPSALIWADNDAVRQSVVSAVASAAKTAARLAAALGPELGAAEDFWRSLFRATYKAEFRVEKAGREDSILSVNRSHFEGLLPLALAAQGIDFARDGNLIRPELSPAKRQETLKWWKARKRLGKPLNLIRLVKASTTFEGAARYAAWKVERHTGVAVEVTPWREKHPILAAPAVLFKVWRSRRAK